MKKAARMKKQLVKTGIVIAVVVVVTGGAMLATGSFKTSELARKATAENTRNQDNSQIATMKTQIEQSGEAEKRFVEIGLKRQTQDYSSNSDVLKMALKEAKERYRFANSFKLTLPLESTSSRPEFSALNFNIIERKPVKIELGAMSDLHVYSFLDELLRKTPGFMQVNKLEIQRRANLNMDVYTQMQRGQNPENVVASIELTWVGIEPKPAVATGNEAAPPQPGAGL